MMIDRSNEDQQTERQVNEESNHIGSQRPGQGSTRVYQRLFEVAVPLTMERFNRVVNSNAT